MGVRALTRTIPFSPLFLCPTYSKYVFLFLSLTALLLELLLVDQEIPSSPLSPMKHTAPFTRPLWPDAYCLDDRLSDVFLGHWFILTIGGLLSLERPQYTVRMYAPWLDPVRFPLAIKSWHNESFELLYPEFEFVLRDPEGSLESCKKFGGLELLHHDRPLPDSGVVLFRDFFLAKVQALAPFEPMQESNLFYFTRKVTNDRQIHDRIPYVRRRVIENEEEFVPGLVSLGFQLIHLEDFALVQKIRLFAGARMVVGPQSAAFAFSPFLTSETDIVEIFPDLDLMKHYCYLARSSGAFWQRYTGVTTVGVHPTTNFGNGAFNMIVTDPDHFIEHIRQLLENPTERAHPIKCNIGGDPAWPQYAATD